MSAARKLDNLSTPRDTRAAKGRSAEIIHIGAHRRDAAPEDNAYGCECAISPSALDHIGADMTPEAAARARVEHRHRLRMQMHRPMFIAEPVKEEMSTFERLGHEVAVRVGSITIVGLIVALAKGWI